MQDYNTILKRLQVKKNSGLMLAASYWRLGKIELAGLVAECGTFIGIQEGVGIVEANFCKQRLCPSCAWRRSVKIYGGTSHILDYLDEKYGKDIKYLFLTLTVKNVFLEDLGKAIDDMAEAFKRLINNKAWKRRVKGAMRTLEITVNYEKRTAHPHYHLILAVDRSYATKGDKTYWTQEDWQRVWQKAARLDYAPQVYIERIKAKKKVRDACKTKEERERADRRYERPRRNGRPWRQRHVRPWRYGPGSFCDGCKGSRANNRRFEPVYRSYGNCGGSRCGLCVCPVLRRCDGGSCEGRGCGNSRTDTL